MRLTRHARERMAEMGVGHDEVVTCAHRPDVSWTGTQYNGTPQTTAKRGRITVILNERGDTVITVLWNTTDQYQRKEKA